MILAMSNQETITTIVSRNGELYLRISFYNRPARIPYKLYEYSFKEIRTRLKLVKPALFRELSKFITNKLGYIKN